MEHLSSIYSVFKDWQTLIAGLLALLGAWLTVREIRAQINLQRTQIADERKDKEEAKRRKTIAIRAHMNDALSDLCRYTEHCASFLIRRDNYAPLPQRPTEEIGVLKSAIEYVDSESAGALFQLVSHYQVHNSRLESYPSRRAARYYTQELYDTSLLRAYINNIFEYARNEEAHIPHRNPSIDQMENALKNCVGLANYAANRQRYELVMRMIEQEHQQAD